jgi:hypothetical protein
MGAAENQALIAAVMRGDAAAARAALDAGADVEFHQPGARFSPQFSPAAALRGTRRAVAPPPSRARDGVAGPAARGLAGAVRGLCVCAQTRMGAPTWHAQDDGMTPRR